MLAKQKGRDRIELHESAAGHDAVPSEGRSELVESLDEGFFSGD
jgi:hypothetical protein